MTIREQIDYCKKRIAKGQDMAEMRAIMGSLLQLEPLRPDTSGHLPFEGEEGQPAGTVFQQMVEIYKGFMEAHNVPFFMDGVQGKALKAIIKKFRAISTIKNDDEQLLKAWRFVFAHWDRVGDFIGRQKSLVQINKNLTEILDKIRNGHNKQAAAQATNQQLRLSLEARRSARNSQEGGGA